MIASTQLALVENNIPAIVTLNETHFQGRRKFQLPGYLSYSRNIIDKAFGGISTSFVKSDSAKSVRIEEGKGSKEFLLTRHCQFKHQLIFEISMDNKHHG